MTNKPKLAILLEFGFHEFKKYIHSGFASELGRDFDVFWFAMDRGNKEFDTHFKATGFPVVYFYDSDFKQAPSKIESYNQAVRRNWMVNNDVGLFHNYKLVRRKSLKSRIIGNNLFKIIFEKIALKAQQRIFSERIGSEFINKKIDKLIFTGYNSHFTKNVIATADRLNVELYYLVNSWKDVFTNNFIPTKSIKYSFVWNEDMTKQFLYHMPYLKEESHVISGNTSFDILINFKPFEDKAFYCNKYSLSEKSDWIYYTMMPPGIVNNEIETILYTAKNLLRVYGNSKQLLIRRNPNHDKNEFNQMELPENIRLTEHYCNFDAQNDMLIQSDEGEKEWLDLLYYSELNLSVPSTATLEFLMLDKKVYNIEFNAENKIDDRLKQFFNAGFYRDLFDDKKVFRIKNIEQLIEKIDAPNLKEKPKTKASKIILEYLKK